MHSGYCCVWACSSLVLSELRNLFGSSVSRVIFPGRWPHLYRTALLAPLSPNLIITEAVLSTWRLVSCNTLHFLCLETQSHECIHNKVTDLLFPVPSMCFFLIFSFLFFIPLRAIPVFDQMCLPNVTEGSHRGTWNAPRVLSKPVYTPLGSR